MCIYRDRLIVCDTANFRLQFIDISAADAKDWKFDAPFGSIGPGKGQFNWPEDAGAAGGTLFAAEQGGNRVQSFKVAVSKATRTLTLTHRSFFGVTGPQTLAFSPDSSRVFVGADGHIRFIDVEGGTGTVRHFAEVLAHSQMVVSDHELYAVAVSLCRGS
jgi:hypothetical protein